MAWQLLPTPLTPKLTRPQPPRRYAAALLGVFVELSLLTATTQARKSLLDALRQVDRMVNRTDPDTERELIEQRGLSDVVELYTRTLKEHHSFQVGNRLGHVEGDNFVVFYNDDDRAVKQSIIDAVVHGILLSEEDLETVANDQLNLLRQKIAQQSSEDEPLEDNGAEA